MSGKSDKIEANELRNRGGNKRRLSIRDKKTVLEAWERYDGARTAFALDYTRTNYNNLKSAGAAVVEMQDKLDVWLIHPANVGPGLAEHDPRIKQ